LATTHDERADQDKAMHNRASPFGLNLKIRLNLFTRPSPARLRRGDNASAEIENNSNASLVISTEGKTVASFLE